MYAPAPTMPAAAAFQPDHFLHRLMQITGDSGHSYELAMHRLLADLAEQEACGRLSRFEVETVLGTALDVLFFFNYDPAMLMVEPDHWYRASIIHQMAIAMLQTLGTLRPDLAAQAFFAESVSALAFERTPSNTMAPLCTHWAPLLANAG